METDAAPLMLSVSGMRGLVGKSLTPRVVARYAIAFGRWLTEQTSGQPHVLVGRDSRPSGEMYEIAAVAGLVHAGCRTTRLGIVTTPGVAVMIKHLRGDGGLVITASHNPAKWNGVKPLRGTAAPPPEQVAAIIERYHDTEVPPIDRDAAAPGAIDDSTAGVHRDAILPHIDIDAIRSAKLKAVIDSVHGAGGPETRTLLDHLGVEPVHLFVEPTGAFPHTPEPVREHLTALCDAVTQHGADLGFAQDPDADRLAMVDENGTYIGEEYTFALCAAHKLGRGDTTATNLSTSRMIDDIAGRAGAKVVRTPVGEANVAAAMKQHGAAIGGEGNGGVILPAVSHVRDSLAGMALLLEMLAQRRVKLSEIVQQVPRYAIVKDKVPIDPVLTERLAPVMRDRFAEQKIDEQDGVRVDWPDRWVHVRPSNTEPIVRVIAEAGDEAEARALIAETKTALGL